MEYRNLLKEWGLTLQSDVLDPAFAQKANEFEAKVSNSELTDDEIKVWDDDLVACFKELHNFEETDSEEVILANRKLETAEAKTLISEASDIDSLTALQNRYKHLTEITSILNKKIEKTNKESQASAQNTFLANANNEILAANYSELIALQEKYKDYDDLSQLINTRIEEGKPEESRKNIREKLADAKKREWTYDDLRAIGIKPTGDDMEIEGVYLQRQYLFKVYHIVRVDGKKV